MTHPDPTELRSLLDHCRPATVLKLLEAEEFPPQLAVFKAEALADLDRYQEAHDFLDPYVSKLEGDDFAEAERVWAYLLLRGGWFDGAILSAQSAARAARSEELRAACIAVSAVGYAYKRCWGLAEAALREAIELAPNNPRVLISQARMRLEADQRLQARAVYERLATIHTPWAWPYAQWGLGHVSYLLGEFDQARDAALAALKVSDEWIAPLFTLAQVALALDDVPALRELTGQMEQRSPQAAGLQWMKDELARLEARCAPQTDASRKRLQAFPTTVQRRNYCGPSTIELVLRYWKGGLDLSNDQIAEQVKFPHAGTPVYRMREFFHLLEFDTVRCLAPVDQLKTLIAAGYPVIVQEEFSNSSHVAVVIGYDDASGTIELQDPITHAVTVIAMDEFGRLRHTYLDSAIVAFPRVNGHDKTIARLGLFDDQAIIWTDQAALELDEGRFQAAADLMGRAVQRKPAHALSWITWLTAELELWKAARRSLPTQSQGLAARLNAKPSGNPAAARQRFYDVLENARKVHPGAEFTHQFEGAGALLDNDLPRALEAFERAVEADPGDARNYASLAECQFALRQVEKALESANNAVQRDPTLPAANAWAARCHAFLGHNNAEHYARAAADQASNWWLPHQALAEAYTQHDDYPAARREVELALSLSPDNPEARVLRGILNSFDRDASAALAELESILAGPQPLTPITAFKAWRALCSVLYNARVYDAAAEQAGRMLGIFPADPWVMQFQAMAFSESLLQSEEPPTEAGLMEMRRLYQAGIEANNGATWVVRDHLRLLEALAGPQAAVAAAASLSEKYPDNGGLVYLHAQYLGHARQNEPAARLMLATLRRADGIQDRDELYQAVALILEGLGPIEGATALAELPVPEGGVPLAERQRCLGLLLALYPEDAAERARELLRAALQNDPNDAFIAMRLGDVAEDDAEREQLYRRALMQAQRWPYARASLAHFLVDQERPQEALEFTTGHETDSLEVLAAHGRALVGAAHYEEAAAAFNQAIQQSDSPISWLYVNKWYAERECGRFSEALATAQEGLALFPDDPRWHTRLAGALRSLGRFDESNQAIETGKAHGLAETDVLKAQYETAWAQKDYRAALAAVDGLLEAGDEEPAEHQLTWWEEKRLRLLVELGRLDEARQFAGAKELNAEGWGEAAWAISRTEQEALCLEFAERALALDPENYAGLYNRAQSLSDLDREDEAIAAFHRLREAHPDEHNAYEKLALRLAVEGKTDEALQLAERAVELGSFCTYAWATRGYVYFVRGQRPEALADLESAWNRADVDERRRSYDYWWVLAALQNDAGLAAHAKQQAIEEAKTALDRRIIAQVETLLQQTSLSR